MWGIIEFREDEHRQNVQSLHKMKEEICILIDRMEKGGHHDERRGMYGAGMDERKGGMSNRGGYGNHFPYPESYPQYPMYDERYRY